MFSIPRRLLNITEIIYVDSIIQQIEQFLDVIDDEQENRYLFKNAIDQRAGRSTAMS